MLRLSMVLPPLQLGHDCLKVKAHRLFTDSWQSTMRESPKFAGLSLVEPSLGYYFNVNSPN